MVFAAFLEFVPRNQALQRTRHTAAAPLSLGR